ncbi:hypothetical protein COCOBI_05-7040 [Coccomyxa sp. Obi]|nr:hypothetical protein COCOBI_05-7040 [Coccomyxa sp. Obi]
MSPFFSPCRALRAVLAAWSIAVDDEHVARLIAAKEEQTEKALDLQAALEKARSENERMFRDNARLVRLIDSGDWGRARVLELVQAGQVLQRERDALAQLVQNMPQGRRTSQASIVQEPSTKRRSSAALQTPIAPQQPPKPLAPPKADLHSPTHRNKLLVHSASSYNALVRALKQEILEGHHKALHDSNALQEINKVSLAAVHVEELSPHAQGVAFGRSNK